MTEPKIWVYFYGSYINFDVLREVDLVVDEWEVAKLAGFDIRIAPRANLVRSDQHCVYGILAKATHRELERLYIEHSKGILGETYLPEAVLVETSSGTWRAAICYICPEMVARTPAPDYVQRIIGPARRFDFPEWYIARLESFMP
ncbi:MAG TPA: gamma-glutamylcyclotransferase family protein [Polyangiaceae bacterium]|nr:gamma-glutamylcyclotransferase family protein [Polyangiaceae bacterium]